MIVVDLIHSTLTRAVFQFTDLFTTTFYRPIHNNITSESSHVEEFNVTDIDLKVFLNAHNEVRVFFLDSYMGSSPDRRLPMH